VVSIVKEGGFVVMVSNVDKIDNGNIRKHRNNGLTEVTARRFTELVSGIALALADLLARFQRRRLVDEKSNGGGGFMIFSTIDNGNLRKVENNELTEVAACRLTEVERGIALALADRAARFHGRRLLDENTNGGRIELSSSRRLVGRGSASWGSRLMTGVALHGGCSSSGAIVLIVGFGVPKS